MIKCNVNVCALISKSAVMKESKGQQFFTFNIKIPVKGRDGAIKELEISVSHDGGKGKAAMFTSGRRVAINGTLTIRKKNDRTFYNLRSDGDAELTKATAEDNITGTMEFKGKTGKNEIVTKKDKNEKTFKSFSAFSRDKDGDNADFTWVNFLYFDPKEGEDFLAPQKYIHVTGELQLGLFKDDISLTCRVSKVEPWEMENRQ